MLYADNPDEFLDRTGIRAFYGQKRGKFVPADMAVKNYPADWTEIPMDMRREMTDYGLTDKLASTDWPEPFRVQKEGVE